VAAGAEDGIGEVRSASAGFATFAIRQEQSIEASSTQFHRSSRPVTVARCVPDSARIF
jgi:hypothetical protein